MVLVGVVIAGAILLLSDASPQLEVLYLAVAAIAYGGAAYGVLFSPSRYAWLFILIYPLVGALLLDVAATHIWTA